MHACVVDLARRQARIRGKHMLLDSIHNPDTLMFWIESVWEFIDMERLPDQIGHISINLFLRFIDRIDGDFLMFLWESFACVWIAWKLYMDRNISGSAFLKLIGGHPSNVRCLCLGEINVTRILEYRLSVPLCTDLTVVIAEHVNLTHLSHVMDILRISTLSTHFIMVSPLTLAASALVMCYPHVTNTVCELIDRSVSRVGEVTDKLRVVCLM